MPSHRELLFSSGSLPAWWGHLKATAAKPSPPCHAMSCPAWVPGADSQLCSALRPKRVPGATGQGGFVVPGDRGHARSRLLNAF